MTERDEAAREALLRYFSQNGLLLCNESAQLPYLDLVGGSWNAMVSLLESGDAFYSRFYQNRVTYLSPALYFALKSRRRRAERLDESSKRLLSFLRAAGETASSPPSMRESVCSDFFRASASRDSICSGVQTLPA